LILSWEITFFIDIMRIEVADKSIQKIEVRYDVTMTHHSLDLL